jgi:hypothetical protein
MGKLGVTSFFETRSCYEAQASLEILSFLPQPPDSWDYRCALPCLAVVILIPSFPQS